MDEVLFRSSQKIENMQLQAELVATKTKEALVLYSQQGRLLASQLWNSTTAEQLKAGIREFYVKLLSAAKDFQAYVVYFVDPRYIYRNFVRVFGRKWTKRDIYFGCAGFILGGIIGLGIGLVIRKKSPAVHYMQAIQCNHYLGVESVTVVEDAIAPYECEEYDVLVNVKAASVQRIDLQICNGYGKTLRRILRNVYESDSDLPVILGRDCTGIITDIGCKVKRLEVGDEVWLAVPFWSQGTLCQTVLATESRVSRKPKNIGFEGACSLPYAGSIALSILEEAGIDLSNASNKKILIEGGCTPAGCVLIQLLHSWKAVVSATCQKRAVPVVKALGASDIIVLSESKNINDKSELEMTEELQLVKNALLKELELKGNVYDLIVKTSPDCEVSTKDLSKFCSEGGTVLSTLPPVLSSDSYGVFGGLLLSLYVNLKYRFQKVLGLPTNDFDETHLCYTILDRLTDFVEDGSLQTVVDKVFPPHDIEIAVGHLQSPQSIGSTVVTFR